MRMIWVLSFLCGALATRISSDEKVSLKGEDATGMANTLSAPEKAAGWKLLFDGQSTTGWRGFRKASFPEKGWIVEDGWLKHLNRQGGGDIVTEEMFSDFELRWEWKMPAKANSGLKYLVTESRTQAIGHEYQMIDDSIVRNADQMTASFYDVLPTDRAGRLRPMGEVNESRIVVQGNHVEHWLNGEKVLEYELGSERVMQAVAGSKFKGVTGFGTKQKGRILLTDHRDETSFRNIKIRVRK